MAPRKLFNEDGDEIEVPTEEELTELQGKAEKSATEALAELNSKLGVPEGTTTEDFVKNLQEEGNPNWKAARQQIDTLKGVIKDQGLEVDTEGKVIKDDSISQEELETKIKATAKQEFLEQYKDSKLSKITDPEDKKVVQHYFDKLSAGEDLDHGKVDSIMASAMQLAKPGDSNAVELITGAPPDISPPKDKADFSESDDGKAAGENMGLKSMQPDAEKESK